MKKLLLTITMLLMLGLSAHGVAAQVDTPEVGGATFDEIEGLESVYDRTYSVDFEALMASPDVDFSEIDPSEMMRSITIQGHTFDSDESAENFLRGTEGEIETSTPQPEDIGEVEVKDIEVVDKDGYTVTIVMDLEGTTLVMTMHVFVDGNQVFMISGTDSELEASGARADAVAQYVVDAEVENEEVMFNADGTSTGGVYDRMPAAGDEIVGDLIPTDFELFPGE